MGHNLHEKINSFLNRVNGKLYQIGWKTIVGIVCLAVSFLAGYFDWISGDIAVVCASASGILLVTGVRVAAAKVLESLAIFIEAMDKLLEEVENQK